MDPKTYLLSLAVSLLHRMSSYKIASSEQDNGRLRTTNKITKLASGELAMSTKTTAQKRNLLKNMVHMIFCLLIEK
jgi:hypothetical protein